MSVIVTFTEHHVFRLSVLSLLPFCWWGEWSPERLAEGHSAAAVGTGLEPRWSGSAVFYLDCSRARQGCRPCGLREGRVTKDNH